MTSRTRKTFWRDYARLPKPVQAKAKTKAAYRQFILDSTHPGLQFKQVHPTLPVWPSTGQLAVVPEPTQMVFVAGIGATLGAWRLRKLRRNGRGSNATAC